MPRFNSRSYRDHCIRFTSRCIPDQRGPSLVLPPDRNIREGLILSTPIMTLSVPEIEVGTAGADINNVEYVGSYDWTNERQPTIIVPGSPPEWNDRSLPFTLQPDVGLRFVDQDGYRMRGSTLLPLMKAADAAGTTVDWPNIDVVTDRNGLRKLARWIVKGAEESDFRIDIELGGDRTLLMSRWEPNTRDAAGNGRSFGFGFEEATTRPVKGCERSTGHYRIIKYDFLGLSMVVRYAVDACLPPTSSTIPKGSSASVLRPSESYASKLSNQTTNAEVFMPSAPVSPVSPSAGATPTLNIIHAGRQVPQSSIIELTSRSQNYIHRLDWSDILLKLHLSQIPLLYLGLHQRGAFSEIRQQCMPEEVEAQRGAALGMFTKLAQILKEVRELMAVHADKKLSLVCEAGVLRVYERATMESCLPEEVMGRFVASPMM